jgi:hypothetical protein
VYTNKIEYRTSRRPKLYMYIFYIYIYIYRYIYIHIFVYIYILDVCINKYIEKMSQMYENIFIYDDGDFER